MKKISKSFLRKIIKEEFDYVYSKKELYIGDNIPSTVFVVVKPTRFNPNDVIDQMIDPGSPTAGGKGIDLNIVEDLMVRTYDFDFLLSTLANRGNEFASKVLGVFADKKEAVQFAADSYLEMI